MLKPWAFAVVGVLAATAAGAEPDLGQADAAPLRARVGCGFDQKGLASSGSGTARADVDLPRADCKASLWPDAEAAGTFSGPARAGLILAASDLVGSQARLRGTPAPRREVGRVSGRPIDTALFGRDSLPSTVTRNLIADTGDAGQGLAYAQKNCVECHNVLNSTAPSPNGDAPPFRTVANTPGMTITALTVWSRTSHPSMPNLVIAPPEMDNLIAYILSLRDRK